MKLQDHQDHTIVNHVVLYGIMSQRETVKNCYYVNIVKKKWKGLSGSTSNPLKHIRESHYNMLSDEDKGLLSNNGATSGKTGVRRTLSRKIYDEGALARVHPSVKGIV